MFLAIDTHVHIYECYNFEELFIIAKRNFEKLFPDFAHVICFTERNGENYDGLLKKNGINFEVIDNCLIRINLPENKHLYALAGKQVVTVEKVEVLGLGVAGEFADGNTLEATINQLRAADAVVVLPWGFGKWTGKRRELIRDCLASGRTVITGDIPQRSQLIKSIEKLSGLSLITGNEALWGSDPLPVVGEESQIGTFAVSGEIKDYSSNDGQQQLTGRLIKDMLANPSYKKLNAGTRNSTIKAISRFLSLKR